MDKDQIKPGDRIIPKINEGLENSQFIIPCFSKNQVESGWSNTEYEAILYEILNNKTSSRKILPLLMDDVDIPWLAKDMLYTKLSDAEAYQNLIDYLVENRNL